jgi:hypothetical protein
MSGSENERECLLRKQARQLRKRENQRDFSGNGGQASVILRLESRLSKSPISAFRILQKNL